ncbi:MAG: diaminopimelate decarboxylase family protein, partial [Ktedonobacterales bacterium]
MPEVTPAPAYPGDPPPHAHLWPDTARVTADWRLTIGGLDVAALAREHGTPLYIYDAATLRGRMRAFTAAFAARWAESAVAYAGKAYLAPALCALLNEAGLELDAVSAGEVGLALRAGYPAGRIHLHGTMKPDAELADALDAGGTGVGRVVVDSLDELARVAALGEARGRRVAIWLRVNPDVATQTHASIQTGHADSKFGLDLASGAALEAARRAAAAPWLDLAGLHAHAGSQLFDAAPAVRVVERLAALAATIREQTGATISEVSPG